MVFWRLSGIELVQALVHQVEHLPGSLQMYGFPFPKGLLILGQASVIMILRNLR